MSDTIQDWAFCPTRAYPLIMQTPMMLVWTPRRYLIHLELSTQVQLILPKVLESTFLDI